MGIRGFVRDILSLLLAYRVLKVYFSPETLNNFDAFLAVLLGGITIWFLLEKIGILPRY